MISAHDLAKKSLAEPPKPVIAGLVDEYEIFGLHGNSEVYKTYFLLQLAEALATGGRFLGVWQVVRSFPTFFLETEMHANKIGERVRKMYGESQPEVYFASHEEIKKFKRLAGMAAKFALLNAWLAEAKAEVLILDTANSFFRGENNPNAETVVGSFFDHLEACPVLVKIFSRHNHRPNEFDSDRDGAARIRGSGQWREVPDVLRELRRMDRRTHKAVLAETKYRGGPSQDDIELWFDAARHALTALPPEIELLRHGPLTRPELLKLMDSRFGISERLADERLKAQQLYLRESMQGHSRLYDIDRQAAEQAEWSKRLTAP